jgi:hypothetical protein
MVLLEILVVMPKALKVFFGFQTSVLGWHCDFTWSSHTSMWLSQQRVPDPSEVHRGEHKAHSPPTPQYKQQLLQHHRLPSEGRLDLPHLLEPTLSAPTMKYFG